MLPPANFQEDPAPVLAHRTSPTNLGLYLLSVASARDFAWLGTNEAAEQLEATLATMGNLSRFRGHFYNWYDTSDLRPLDPPYVSTVDSGNLAGHLIALANACHEWTVLTPTATQRLAGITDALDLAREASDLLRDRRTQTVTWRQIDARSPRFRRAYVTPDWMIHASQSIWPTLLRRSRRWPTSHPLSRANAATTRARTCCSG
jgi:cyclic beta-1,2-glucan synthetase